MNSIISSILLVTCLVIIVTVLIRFIVSMYRTEKILEQIEDVCIAMETMLRIESDERKKDNAKRLVDNDRRDHERWIVEEVSERYLKEVAELQRICCSEVKKIDHLTIQLEQMEDRLRLSQLTRYADGDTTCPPGANCDLLDSVPDCTECREFYKNTSSNNKSIEHKEEEHE